jgi:beta-glucosidase
MKYTFPDQFLWGTATAAHQVEGNNINSDFWVMENQPGTIFVEPSGDAIDHYHRYREDIAMLAALGFNMYRFSIEWARVEPEEGFFSQAIIEHYRQMLIACHEHNLKPMVTLHHFTTPRWVMKAGGWSSSQTAEWFGRYCEKIAQQLGDLIFAACTINEANIGSILANSGYAPKLESLHQSPWWDSSARLMDADPKQMLPFMFATTPESRQVIVTAHGNAVQALRSSGCNFPVGITLALQDIQAVEGGEENAAKARYDMNTSWLEAVRADDFVGVQTYSRQRYGAQGPLPPEEGVELTQMGYEFYPEALEATLREAAETVRIPLIVTENGIGTQDDARRMEYVQRALKGVVRCLQDGMDIRGYTCWSAFDNFEWMLGYRPTFGLIHVNRETKTRTPKPSARWLGATARANCLDLA